MRRESRPASTGLPVPTTSWGTTCSRLAAESYEARITSSFDRTTSPYHKLGYDVFTPRVLTNIGGVLSQTNTLFDDSGSRLSVSVTAPDYEEGVWPGHIILELGEQTARYPIAYKDLIPMALFVESGGTALYTAWEPEGGLATGFAQEAGFVPHDTRGYIAFEFSNSRFSSALEELDFCVICRGPSEPNLVETAQHELSNMTHDTTEMAIGIPGSYIVTDVGVTYAASAERGDTASIQGPIIRYSWRFQGAPAERSIDIYRALRYLRATEIKNQIGEEEARVMDQEISDIGDGFFLFETLALLRSARKDSPQEYANFMESIRDEKLIEQNQAPWDKFVQTYCQLYPGEEGCV